MLWGALQCVRRKQAVLEIMAIEQSNEIKGDAHVYVPTRNYDRVAAVYMAFRSGRQREDVGCSRKIQKYRLHLTREIFMDRLWVRVVVRRIAQKYVGEA